MTTPARSPASRVKVLVTDAEQRAALAAIRSLGAAGYDVVACASAPHAIGLRSRHTGRGYDTPSPLAEPAAFALAVHQLCAEAGVHLVLPVTEAAHLALFDMSPDSSGRTSPPDWTMAAPTADAFLRATDKAMAREAAGRVGLTVPGESCLDRGEALPEHAPLPCVVKPARSVSIGHGPRVRGGVLYASDRDELARIVHETDQALFPLLLQERVAGSGWGVSLLRWDGRTIAVSGHRRLREKPVSGGVSVAAETVAVPPSLLARCEALLDALGYERGLAMVEFKGDDLHDPVFMEINPRLWGSVQLAIDAGADFPRLLVEAALGELPGTVVHSRPGVRLRWGWGSVDHVLQRVRRGLDARGEPESGGMPSVVAALVRERIGGAREEVWRRDDPRPFLAETWNWVLRR